MVAAENKVIYISICDIGQVQALPEAESFEDVKVTKQLQIQLIKPALILHRHYMQQILC